MPSQISSIRHSLLSSAENWFELKTGKYISNDLMIHSVHDGMLKHFQVPPKSVRLTRLKSCPASITEWQVGKDLKDHLVQAFLAKAQSRQDSPAPCSAESQKCPVLGNPPLPLLFQLLLEYYSNGCSHCENFQVSWISSGVTDIMQTKNI